MTAALRSCALLGAVLALSGALASPARAQALAGAVAGRVVDSERAPVGGATVAFEHLASGHAPERTTNARGRYTQRGLRIDGPYRVWTWAPGFRWETALVQPYLLQTARHDVRLLRENECDAPDTAWRYERGRERAPCNRLELLPPVEIEAAAYGAAELYTSPETATAVWHCDRGFCLDLPPSELSQ